MLNVWRTPNNTWKPADSATDGVFGGSRFLQEPSLDADAYPYGQFRRRSTMGATSQALVPAQPAWEPLHISRPRSQSASNASSPLRTV